jgi:hypothetical protein
MIAVACCAGLPVIGAVVGGVTGAAVIGIAGGVLAVVAVLAGAVLAFRARRRRRSPPGEVAR